MINKNYLKSANGQVSLIIPLKRSGGHAATIFSKQCVDYSWIKLHRREIHQAYSKCPYYDELHDPYVSMYNDFQDQDLVSILKQSVEFVTNYLNIENNITESDISQLKGSDLVLSQVSGMGGTTYVTGTGGLNYLDHESFKLAGVNIEVGKYNDIEYPQRKFKNSPDFISGLSILDMLFNLPKDEIVTLLVDNWERVG